MILLSISPLFDYVSLVDILFYVKYNIKQSTECGNRIWVTSIMKKYLIADMRVYTYPKLLAHLNNNF